MDELLSPSIDMDKLKSVLFKYFVQFYGEKHSEYIKHKLDNCLEVILYNNVDDVARMLRNRDNRKKVELTVEFLRESGIDVQDDIATQMIENNSSYLLKDIPGAKELVESYFCSDSYGDNKNCGFRLCFMDDDNSNWVNINRQRFLKSIGADCGDMDPLEFLQTEGGKVYFEMIEKEKQIISVLDNKYQEFRKPYEQYYPIIDKFVRVKSQINNKYSLQFLSSISDLLTDKDRNIINDCISNNDFEGFNRIMFNLDCYGSVFKYLHSASIVEMFSTETSLELESSETLEFRKRIIIDDRMEYFRVLGLNPDGKSYEELMNSLDSKDIPDSIVVDRVVEQREKYLTMAENEYSSLAINYDRVVDKANSLGLMYRLGLSVENLASNSQFTVPNVRKNNGEVVGVVCYSPLKAPDGDADVMFIHEVNHMMDLNLLAIENGEPLYKVGFSHYNNGDDEITDFEMFNETVNHLVAMDITEMMHKDGVYIFDDSKTAKIRGSANYEHNNSIVEKFYRTFTQDILDSRLAFDLSSLTSLVGEENFKGLNSIVNRYSELPYYNLMEDVRLERDTPLRSEGLSLIRQANELTDAMKIYNHNASIGQNKL